MDFSLFAELFYNANYLPSLALKDGAPEAYFGSAPARKLLLAAVDMFDTSSGCSQIVSSGEASYACIPQKGSPFALVIGPAAFTQGGARKRWDALTAREEEEMLSSLPEIYYNRFINIVRLTYLSLNGEAEDIPHFFGKATYARKKEAESLDAPTGNTTYAFEKKLLSFIYRGEPEALKDFLLNDVPRTDLTEGKVGENALRQAKNIFVGFISVAGKGAAIPGGAGAAEIYRVMSDLINECERCRTVESVKRLQLGALIELAERVRAAKLPRASSGSIRTAIRYIRDSVCEPVNVSDMAERAGMSVAAFRSKFSRETGISPKNYLLSCRLEEGRRLLAETDIPLPELAAALQFSSQSHFQNAFRKKFGVTPRNYRIVARDATPESNVFEEPSAMPDRNNTN